MDRDQAALVGAILTTLARYHPVDCRLVIDGTVHDLRMSFLAVANTPWYGGGVHIAPHARPDSGTLAVVAAADLGRIESLWVLLQAFSGSHLRHPKVMHTTAREIQVESHIPLAVHADGETIGSTPATFHVLPGALEVMVPSDQHVQNHLESS